MRRLAQREVAERIVAALKERIVVWFALPAGAQTRKFFLMWHVGLSRLR
jgi:hypothetical protein